jgi:hypothetical protein
MFAYLNGDAFLCVIDTMGECKDAHDYICNAFVRYIEIVGGDNIVQIFISNISNMWNVIDLMICHFLSLYFQGCASHCLDLLNIKDWKKKPQ